MDHLIIGDPHAKPGNNFERFRWAGRLAADRKPGLIVNIGDWFDMPSLSSYDKGKKAFEGRRYKNDIDAGTRAIDYFETELAKSKGFKPRKRALEGNHEHRAARAANLSPELEGTVGTDGIVQEFEKNGWLWTPYEGATPGTVTEDGITYAHYFISGVKGNPIGGENAAYSLIRKQLTSCVVGHSHLRDFAERTTATGKRVLGLVVGCFLTDFEDYAGTANGLWWSGLTYLHDVKNGNYDHEFISMERLKKMYA